ncbi:MAG: 1-deoxy-D-xylulose-5-phosphate reductoisomerase [Candidatus Omnitrophota bacterium]
MQRIAILGSTGSIGISALNVISGLKDEFSVAALSTNYNISLLSQQVKIFKPQAVCIADKDKAVEFKRGFRRGKLKVYAGEEGLCSMLKDVGIDTLLVGIVGSSALMPVLTGLDCVKRIALANKEALVMAGDIIMEKARRKNVRIVPVDSEHSAVFQCLEAGRKSEIKNIYLTGSGGPFLNVPEKDFKNITPQQAINHPRWKMGKKISVDSATMMNKGLEIIEAHHLFNVAIDNIRVLIHPEAIVHSMVEFRDGAMLAQLGVCDMRMPIQYALTYPLRVPSPVKEVEFSISRALNFQVPDFGKFPCLDIAYEAAKKEKAYPCVLNASNEVAVDAFLKGKIRFTDIPKVIEKVLGLHKGVNRPKLDEILKIDKWARIRTKEILNVVGN